MEFIYKIETHAHTAESSPCSRLSAEQLIGAYAQAGYAGVVVTDHLRFGYTVFAKNRPDEQIHKFLAGYDAACAAGEKYGVKVYLGAELYFEQDPQKEFLVYGADSNFLRDSLPFLTGSLEHFYSFAVSRGVLVVHAHPYRYTDYPANPVFVDGAEVYNLHPGHRSRNELALDYAKKNHLIPLSGSDAHELHHVGRGGIRTAFIPTDVLELRDLIQCGEYQLITGEEK